jgi:hypothetical protein
MKRIFGFLAFISMIVLFMVLSLDRAYGKDDRIMTSPEMKYTVIDLKYNEPIYMTKGGALVLLPNNQAIILYTKPEVDEYKKIKEAAIYSETYKAEIGTVSDLTADAFIIRYNELGGKYKLKEVTKDENI